MKTSDTTRHDTATVTRELISFAKEISRNKGKRRKELVLLREKYIREINRRD